MKCLVLGPGGMGIYMMLGYLKSIEERLDIYDAISGSSAGSILAGMLATGMSIDKVVDIALNMDTDYFYKTVSIKNLLTRYGGICPEDLQTWFCQRIGSDLTLKELKKKVYISAYNIKRSQVEYFSNDTHPDMRLSEAIYKSISIPFVFACQDMYIDAALCEELPMGPFLGVPPEDIDIIQIIYETKYEDVQNIFQYASHVATVMLNNRSRYPQFTNRKQLVLDTDETINFNMSTDQKIKMYIKGFKENIISL